MKTAEQIHIEGVSFQRRQGSFQHCADVCVVCPNCQETTYPMALPLNAEAKLLVERSDYDEELVTVDVWGDNETEECDECGESYAIPSGAEFAKNLYRLEMESYASSWE